MTIDVSTMLTDWEWNEKSRPTLNIHASENMALFKCGQQNYSPTIEFLGTDSEDLALQFEGLSELFAEAAKHLRGGI